MTAHTNIVLYKSICQQRYKLKHHMNESFVTKPRQVKHLHIVVVGKLID